MYQVMIIRWLIKQVNTLQCTPKYKHIGSTFFFKLAYLLKYLLGLSKIFFTWLNSSRAVYNLAIFLVNLDIIEFLFNYIDSFNLKASS